MGKRVYFEHKKYAEDTRRMLEENTGVPTELRKSRKGWFCKTKKGYVYTTADGYTVEKGIIVYDEYSNPYEVREVQYAEDQVWLRVAPRDIGEPSKDKDVREGIIWFVERIPEVLMEMKRRGSSKITCSKVNLNHPIHNAVDGRRELKNGDYIFSLKTMRLWRVGIDKRYITITESKEDVRELDKSLESVILVGNEARVVTDVDMLLGSGENRFKSIDLFYANLRSSSAVKRQIIFNKIVSILTNTNTKLICFAVFALTAITCWAVMLFGLSNTFVKTLGFLSVIFTAITACAVHSDESE